MQTATSTTQELQHLNSRTSGTGGDKGSTPFGPHLHRLGDQHGPQTPLTPAHRPARQRAEAGVAGAVLQDACGPAAQLLNFGIPGGVTGGWIWKFWPWGSVQAKQNY